MNNEPAVMRSAKAAPNVVAKEMPKILLEHGPAGKVIATHHYVGRPSESHEIEGTLPAVAAHLGEHMGLEGGEKIESPKDQD